MQPRRGPFGFEVKHGSWKARLADLLDEERRRRPEARGVALVVEGREEPGNLAATLAPLLGADVQRLEGPPGLLNLTELVSDLASLEAEAPLLAVAVSGTANRKDGIRAAWKLGALTDRLWIFIHEAAPPSGLVPTVGQHVHHYLDIIEAAAYGEGPKQTRG